MVSQLRWMAGLVLFSWLTLVGIAVTLFLHAESSMVDLQSSFAQQQAAIGQLQLAYAGQQTAIDQLQASFALQQDAIGRLQATVERALE